MMSWHMLPRSLALRSAFASAGAVFLVCLLGFLLVVAVERRLHKQSSEAALTDRLESELRSLQFKDRVVLAELIAEIRRRSGQAKLHVVLRGADGADLLNLELGEDEGLQALYAAELPLRGCRWAAGTGQVRLCGQTVHVEEPAQDVHLLAGMVMPAEAADPVFDLGWPLAIGMAASIAAALVGYGFSRRLERRLSGVVAVSEAVMAGNLSRRLPLQGLGDEFDRLVGSVNAMLDRIEVLVSGIRQVTDDIAHDMRSPLARLRQRLELALARPRDAATDTETLAGAAEELDQVLATFGALLRISRAEAGVRAAPPAPVDLSALLAALSETYEAVAEDAGQVLRSDVPPGLFVASDAPLLRQAFSNLIENALTHSGEGARLHLGAARQEDGRVVVALADNGPGIPVTEREKVLQRFYRLDRSRGTPGTGLGLALVAAIAQLHGARLELGDAEPGLLVTLTFPPEILSPAS